MLIRLNTLLQINIYHLRTSTALLFNCSQKDLSLVILMSSKISKWKSFSSSSSSSEIFKAFLAVPSVLANSNKETVSSTPYHWLKIMQARRVKHSLDLNESFVIETSFVNYCIEVRFEHNYQFYHKEFPFDTFKQYYILNKIRVLCLCVLLTYFHSGVEWNKIFAYYIYRLF